MGQLKLQKLPNLTDAKKMLMTSRAVSFGLCAIGAHQPTCDWSTIPHTPLPLSNTWASDWARLWFPKKFQACNLWDWPTILKLWKFKAKYGTNCDELRDWARFQLNYKAMMATSNYPLVSAPNLPTQCLPPFPLPLRLTWKWFWEFSKLSKDEFMFAKVTQVTCRRGTAD